MKLLVCGGRNFKDYYWLFTELDRINHTRGIDAVIHGGARGADSLAGKYATERRIQEMVFAADWDMYGPGAGPMRNKRMLVEGKPDAVIAFPGGRGTADMIKQARSAGVTVWEVS